MRDKDMQEEADSNLGSTTIGTYLFTFLFCAIVIPNIWGRTVYAEIELKENQEQFVTIDSSPKMLVRALLVNTFGKEIQLDFCHPKTKELIQYFNWDCLEHIAEGSSFEETINRRLGLVGIIKKKGGKFSVIISNAELPKAAGKKLAYYTKGHKEKLRKLNSWFGGEYAKDYDAKLKSCRYDLVSTYEDGHKSLLLLERQLNHASAQQVILHLNSKRNSWSIVHVMQPVPHDLHWYAFFTKTHLLLLPNKWRHINPVFIELNEDGAYCQYETAEEMGRVTSAIWNKTKGPNRVIRVYENLGDKGKEIYEGLPFDICGQGDEYTRTIFYFSKPKEKPWTIRYGSMTLPLNGLCCLKNVPDDANWHETKVRDSFVKTMRVKNSNSKERSIFIELLGQNGKLFYIKDSYKGVKKSRLAFDTLKSSDDRVFRLHEKEMYVVKYEKIQSGTAKITLKRGDVDIKSEVRLRKGRTIFGYHYSPHETKYISSLDPGRERKRKTDFGLLPFFGSIEPCKFIVKGKPFEELSIKDGCLSYGDGRYVITGWRKCNPGSSPSVDLICIDHEKKTFRLLGTQGGWSVPDMYLCGRYLFEKDGMTNLTMGLPNIFELTRKGPKEIQLDKEQVQHMTEQVNAEYQERERKHRNAYYEGKLDGFKQSVYVKKRLAFEGYSTDKYTLHIVRPALDSVTSKSKDTIEVTCLFSTTSGDLVRKSYQLKLLLF